MRRELEVGVGFICRINGAVQIGLGVCVLWGSRVCLGWVWRWGGRGGGGDGSDFKLVFACGDVPKLIHCGVREHDGSPFVANAPEVRLRVVAFQLLYALR
jgi:hypothetical protein